MPEVVKTYKETSSYQKSFSIQEDLLTLFREDFSKYAPRADKRALDTTWRGIAKNIGKQIKYTVLSQDFSSPTLKKNFDLLCQARLVHRIESTSPAGLPLGASVNIKKFKAIFLDISFVHQFMGVAPDQVWTQKNLLPIYNGALAEQFVGQEFLARQNNELYYWSRDAKNSSAEIDYLITKKDKIYPVEVKSSSSGRLKSLHMSLKIYPDCPAGLILSEAPLSKIEAQRLYFLPLYLSGVL